MDVKITVRELARLTGRSPRQAYNWIHTGALRATWTGTRWEVALSDAEAFVPPPNGRPGLGDRERRRETRAQSYSTRERK